MVFSSHRQHSRFAGSTTRPSGAREDRRTGEGGRADGAAVGDASEYVTTLAGSVGLAGVAAAR